MSCASLQGQLTSKSRTGTSAKATIIRCVLDDAYRVEAIYGHVRDLPAEKDQNVKRLKYALAGAASLPLATEEDCERQSLSSAPFRRRATIDCESCLALTMSVIEARPPGRSARNIS